MNISHQYIIGNNKVIISAERLDNRDVLFTLEEAYNIFTEEEVSTIDIQIPQSIQDNLECKLELEEELENEYKLRSIDEYAFFGVSKSDFL